MTELEQEAISAIAEYRQHGNKTLSEDCFAERRKQQNPAVFVLPSLEAKAWWELPEITEILSSASQEIYAEFVKFKSTLLRDRITKEVISGKWTAYYLMEEGQWDERALAYFKRTQAALKKLPIFQTG